MTNNIRTEQEILKDFEKLGWFVVDGYKNFMLKKREKEPGFIEIYSWCYISINKEKHTYSVVDIHNGAIYEYELSMKEHKLLHELFICWGWLEND